MAQSVKLPDEIMAAVRRESKLQNRSLAEQITHWLRIGRAIEKSSTFDYQHISDALKAALSPDELTSEEQAIWFDQFVAKMVKPNRQEKAFHAKRRNLGRGVGMSSSGELVYEEQNS
jgi:hypothetical protein